MGYLVKSVGVLSMLLFVASVAVAEEKDPLKPRVPPDQMADAKAMKNPVAASPENIAKGKALFEGKAPALTAMAKKAKAMAQPVKFLTPALVISRIANFIRSGKTANSSG
jgi:hypothetical protein